MANSKFFGSERPVKPHLIRGSGGVAAEVGDLRSDVERAFQRLESALADSAKCPVVLSYTSATEVGIGPAPGQGNEVTMRLQDGSYRQLTLPASFDPSASGAGGLDTGAEAPSTFYYLYAVPVSGDDESLQIVGSAADPEVGPTGYTLWRSLGAVYNNSGSNIVPFTQVEGQTYYASARTALTLSGVAIATEGVPQAVSLVDFVPKSAASARLVISLEAAAAADGFVEMYIDGFESLNSYMYLRSRDGEEAIVVVDLPVPGTVKQLFRRLEETVGELDTFKILCLGWRDKYLS